MEFRSLRRSEWKTGMIRRGKAVDARMIERLAVFDERTVFRLEREINRRDQTPSKGTSFYVRTSGH